jgi:hypothetical protein
MFSETLTLLENGHHSERVLRLPCFLLEVGCCRIVGDPYFNLLYVCMLFTNEWIYAYGCKCIYIHIREFVL